ncbi:MAG: hypothetical protein CV089_18055 [Nitrospira sp. WS110]|nr:hypothetical protein [Nitrospira sp. WS110]
MNRTLFLGFLMLALIGTMLHGCKREEVVPKSSEEMAKKAREETVSKGIEMLLTPSSKQYRLDEDIVMEVNFVNRGTTPCWLIPAPEAIIQVLTLTRDGAQLVPSPTLRTHFTEFEEYIRNNRIQLEPQASHSLSWKGIPWTSTGTGIVFFAAPIDSPATQVIWRWPIDRPGVYVLTAQSMLPSSIALPSDTCQMATDPLTITFSVQQN